MANKVNRKSAPRQQVLHIEREGAWGRVEYLHRLACGHTEKRKRPAKTEVMACSWCVVAEEKGRQLASLATGLPDSPAQEDYRDPIGSLIAVTEKEVAKLRAEIAGRFDVPVDYVDVAVEDDEGVMSVSYAVVIIPASDIQTVIQTDKDNP